MIKTFFKIVTENIKKGTLNDMNFTQLANKEKQKRHLACMMAYGKDMPETPHGPKILHKAKRESEIPENADFLNDCKLPRSLTYGIIYKILKRVSENLFLSKLSLFTTIIQAAELSKFKIEFCFAKLSVL